MALSHSSGCRALITKMSMAMSTLPGATPTGKPLIDVTSQTDASIEPQGGDA